MAMNDSKVSAAQWAKCGEIGLASAVVQSASE